MASKGAPKAAGASNSTQLRKAPMSLRSAMRKYAEGGDVNSFSGEDGRSNQSLSFPQLSDPAQEMARAMQTGRINDFAKFQQDIQQPRFPERVRPPEPRYPDTAPSRPEEVRPPEPRYEEPRPEPRRPEEPRYEEPRRPEEPRYEEPRRPEIYPQDYAGPRTTGSTQTQEIGPRTSYRINDDGSRTEIGYDGQPIANYTPEQLAMHYATMGIGQPKFSYVWNGEGYTKVPAGEQEAREAQRAQESMVLPMFPDTAPYPDTAPMPNYDIGYDSGVAPTKDPREEPRYYDSGVAPTKDPREEPRYYEPDTAPYPDTASMPMFPDTAPYPDTAPIPNYDIGYDSDVNKQKQAGQQSEGLSALIAKLLAGGGGGGSLEEQRKLMSLLEMLKGK